MMQDNKTSQPAQEYDGNVAKTIPYYSLFHDETLALVKVVNSQPDAWLDTGCGTGTFAAKAAQVFDKTRFVLADPSAEMLNIAQEKLADNNKVGFTYVKAGTEELDYSKESFDVITAILSHHYFDFETREKATIHCFDMLNKGGLYVTFESIMPSTDRTTNIGLERWKNAQLKNGKSVEAVERHTNRLGIALFPIPIASHLRLLQNSGFSVVEIFWASNMQAGFYAIK